MPYPLHRSLVKSLAALVLLPLIVLAGCGQKTASDLTDDELRDALYNTFTDGDRLDDAAADCLVEYMFANTSRAELNRLSDAEVDELSDDDILFVQDGILACQ